MDRISNDEHAIRESIKPDQRSICFGRTQRFLPVGRPYCDSPRSLILIAHKRSEAREEPFDRPPAIDLDRYRNASEREQCHKQWMAQPTRLVERTKESSQPILGLVPRHPALRAPIDCGHTDLIAAAQAVGSVILHHRP
jgi:hypothetical protein